MKRGKYGDYSPDMKCKIAKQATENGNTRTARKYSQFVGRNLNEARLETLNRLFRKRKNRDVVHGRDLLVGNY